jgi:hypothetical protein
MVILNEEKCFTRSNYFTPIKPVKLTKLIKFSLLFKRVHLLHSLNLVKSLIGLMCLIHHRRTCLTTMTSCLPQAATP